MSLKYAVVCAAGVAVRPILMASKWSSVLRQTDDFGGGVAAVALVGDDQVEGVDRDVELLGVFVDIARRRYPKTACRPKRLMAIRWIVQT